MNYNWYKYRRNKLRVEKDGYSYSIDTELMYPYGHLYVFIAVLDKFNTRHHCIDLTYYNDKNIFMIHTYNNITLSKNNHISDGPLEEFSVDIYDYFQLVSKLYAYTSYEFSKELYDDILYMISYILKNPEYTIENLISSK